jgi:guanylate kinase
LEEWLKDDKVENTPFVIQADEGVGKKTLLVKWMDHHRKNKIGVNI